MAINIDGIITLAKNGIGKIEEILAIPQNLSKNIQKEYENNMKEARKSQEEDG